MIFSNNKGITLEQYKEPMFSKDIIRLPVCDMIRTQSCLEKPKDPIGLSSDDIVAVCREARVIDESDGKHLWKKICDAKERSISSIIIDAIDDEPYISSQIVPAIRYSDELTLGIELLKKAVGVDDVKLEVYKDLAELDTRVPEVIGGVKVSFVGGTYPVEQRAHRAKRKKNSAIFGACSVIALCNAVYKGLFHATCYITVAGDCIANPANYEVPVGYPLADILNDAGLIAEPKRVIVGGSMTGVTVSELDKIGISPTTRGILAFHDEFKKMEESCIGCGRCTNVCPQGLSPYYIYQVLNSKSKSNLLIFDADKCISCGLCSYICPAKLDLQQTVEKAAALTRNMKGEKE